MRIELFIKLRSPHRKGVRDGRQIAEGRNRTDLALELSHDTGIGAFAREKNAARLWELLCLEEVPSRVELDHHSQGGATFFAKRFKRLIRC